MEQLTTSALYHILSDRKLCWEMFPHGQVVIGREPMFISRDNFPLITSECKQIVVSRDVTSDEPLTISFGTGYHSPQGYVYEVDIYAKTGSSDELAQHVLEHVPVARRQMTSEDNLKITVFVVQNYGVNGLIKVLQGAEYKGKFSFSDVKLHTLGEIMFEQEESAQDEIARITKSML